MNLQSSRHQFDKKFTVNSWRLHSKLKNRQKIIDRLKYFSSFGAAIKVAKVSEPVVSIFVKHWGDNLQFYPNFALFSTLGGMNLDHDFDQVWKFSEDQTK